MCVLKIDVGRNRADYLMNQARHFRVHWSIYSDERKRPVDSGRTSTRRWHKSVVFHTWLSLLPSLEDLPWVIRWRISRPIRNMNSEFNTNRVLMRARVQIGHRSYKLPQHQSQWPAKRFSRPLPFQERISWKICWEFCTNGSLTTSKIIRRLSRGPENRLLEKPDKNGNLPLMHACVKLDIA